MKSLSPSPHILDLVVIGLQAGSILENKDGVSTNAEGTGDRMRDYKIFRRAPECKRYGGML